MRYPTPKRFDIEIFRDVALLIHSFLETFGIGITPTGKSVHQRFTTLLWYVFLTFGSYH